MEQFSIKQSGVKQRINEENTMISSLSRLESDIWSVRSRLNFSIKSKQNIENVLRRLAEDVSDEEAAMRNLKNALSNIYNQYEKTERNICGYALDHPITIEDIQKAVSAIGTGLAVSAIWGPSTGLINTLTTVIGGSGPATENGSEEDSIWEQKFKKGIFKTDLWDDLDKAKKDNKYKKHYEMDDDGNLKDKTAEKEAADRAKEGQEKTDAQKTKDILESITLWKGGKKASGSIFELGMEEKQTTDWGNYQHSGGFFNGEAGAEAYVGLGGIGAEIGIAASVFEYKGEGQVGSDMLGVHGEAEVAVGKAEASAGADIGLWDDEGSFNPQAGLSATAELIGGEIGGKVGVELEVDLSGTIDAASEFVGNAYDKGVELASEAGEYIGEKYDAAKDYVGNKLDEAGDAISDFGESISDGWNSMWSWL